MRFVKFSTPNRYRPPHPINIKGNGRLRHTQSNLSTLHLLFTSPNSNSLPTSTCCQSTDFHNQRWHLNACWSTQGTSGDVHTLMGSLPGESFDNLCQFARKLVALRHVSTLVILCWFDRKPRRLSPRKCDSHPSRRPIPTETLESDLTGLLNRSDRSTQPRCSSVRLQLACSCALVCWPKPPSTISSQDIEYIFDLFLGKYIFDLIKLSDSSSHNEL